MRPVLVVWIVLGLLPDAAVAPAQQPSPPQNQQPNQPPPQAQTNDGKTRVYVSDSSSWEMSGGWGASGGSGGGAASGGARPQTAEIIKTVNQRCPEIVVTNNKERANYALLLDHEGGKGALRHKNKVAVFNRDGDAIFSDSTLSLGGAVQSACEAIRKDAGLTPKPKKKT